MKLPKIIAIIFTLVLPILTPFNSHPHPGRTDANGCHTCRTNCTERWGIPYGFYHRHYPVRPCFTNEKPASTTVTEFPLCGVTQVIDGDTFECKLDNGKREKVRLIGVDTPESRRNTKAEKDAERSGQNIETIVSLGEKATNFTKSYLKQGSTIKLELDVQPRDKYGRILAYAYLPDGTMLNALLVQEGYAQVMTIPPNIKYQDLFLKLQREARENNKGLWKQ